MALPVALAVTKPLAFTDATVSLELLQVTLLSAASAGVTVSVNCVVSPTLMVAVF
ncbi:Putative prophage lcu4 protein [Latilactobacillus curvatus]|nr:Putative prophage lcu4 protein [Latilactobacillus curvatus]